MSPDGNSVYVDNQESNTVSQYNVGAGGLLSPKTPPSVHSGRILRGSRSAQTARVLRNGHRRRKHLAVRRRPRRATVAKSPPEVPAGPAPDRIAASPHGGSVYVTNNEVSGTVSQFDVGASGALSAKTPATVPAGAKPLGIALSPDGKSLYTADQQGYVSQFDVGAGGLLTAKTHPDGSGRDCIPGRTVPELRCCQIKAPLRPSRWRRRVPARQARLMARPPPIRTAASYATTGNSATAPAPKAPAPSLLTCTRDPEATRRDSPSPTMRAARRRLSTLARLLTATGEPPPPRRSRSWCRQVVPPRRPRPCPCSAP